MMMKRLGLPFPDQVVCECDAWIKRQYKGDPLDGTYGMDLHFVNFLCFLRVVSGFDGWKRFDLHSYYRDIQLGRPGKSQKKPSKSYPSIKGVLGLTRFYRCHNVSHDIKQSAYFWVPLTDVISLHDQFFAKSTSIHAFSVQTPPR